ncbi:hypothetical protein C8A05DRAFT_43800 [Staphylotrichum tortipilum]|uniref:Uncharacterized protein n=1 Tax=Staphylotrichum tortipilum TaxID=2831512 RepID=A0AAN6MMU5_9PEZI|nr:hypothetical protein C8A05DRAFT_43800 [Staphylotrichum longicolle]
MSGAVRSAAAAHFRGALTRWPKDPLRPDCQLQDVLAKRLDKGVLAPRVTSGSQDNAELRQANALISLLENRYRNKFPTADIILRPKSNPEYYQNLVKELEEAPTRTWLSRISKRLSGMIRF